MSWITLCLALDKALLFLLVHEASLLVLSACCGRHLIQVCRAGSCLASVLRSWNVPNKTTWTQACSTSVDNCSPCNLII